MNQQLNTLFQGLDKNGDISNNTKSGIIFKKVGELASTSIHVFAMFYCWQDKPKYYACRSFYANGSFSEIAGSPLMKLYNQKNKEKIHEFSTLEDLEKFIS